MLSIAPMIDWTYTHFRVLMRILAPSALLYTEMQTTGAIKNNPERALSFNQREEPVVLQLGGSDPHALAECAQKAELQGYAQVNLNLGCPSDKVQAGRFGACLMAEPKLASHCIRAMKDAVSIPVTAKVRIGIDKDDSYDFFRQFATQLIDAGSDALIVHARKAWLRGLNPKQNRTIPPLHYDYVYRLKQEFSALPVIINGNILHLDDIHAHLEHVDGVMLGRLACQNPYAIAEIHHALYPDVPLIPRIDALKQYVEYAILAGEQGAPLSLLLKPLFNFSHGLLGAKHWKQLLMSVQLSKDVKELQKLEVFPEPA